MNMTRFSERQICVGAFIVCLLLNLAFSAVGFNNSLQELHPFRQLQTATTARYLQEEGFSLAYPTPVFGPPWTVPMEFPIYQECVVLVRKLTGLPLEQTGRLIALLFLYLSLPAIYGAAEFIQLNTARRWLLLGLILLSPVYLYYSRSFMIESTALCLSAWFLFTYCRGLSRASTRWLAMAAFFGVVASLAKVTTFIVFLVMAAAFTLHLLWSQWRQSLQRTKLIGTAVRGLLAALPAVAIGVAWVRFSDHVKADNPFAARLVSSNLTAFNFGTVEQRLSLDFWRKIYSHTTITLVPMLNLALVAAFPILLGRKYRGRALLLLGGFLAGPLIFSNLYFVHDYYFYATGVFLLAVLVLGWSQVLDLQEFSAASRGTLIALSLGLQVWAFSHSYFKAQIDHDPAPPEVSTILAATTNPDDVLMIFGRDWDTQVPYYAHRRAVMVTQFMEARPELTREVLRRLKPGQIGALVVTGELRQHPDFYEQFTAELGLEPSPTFASQDTVVYLRHRNLESTIARLDPKKLKTFSFADVSAMNRGVRMPRQRTYVDSVEDQKIFSMMEPRPTLVVHPFPLGAHLENNAPVFNAHAPTDLIFHVPPGTKTARASFAMSSLAYDKERRTDGVEFRVEWTPSAGGNPQILYSMYLSPTDRPEDRGLKSFTVALPQAPDGGQVNFRTLPGPTGSIAFAWAYWTTIKLE